MTLDDLIDLLDLLVVEDILEGPVGGEEVGGEGEDEEDGETSHQPVSVHQSAVTGRVRLDSNHWLSVSEARERRRPGMLLKGEEITQVGTVGTPPATSYIYITQHTAPETDNPAKYSDRVTNRV